MDIGCNKLSYSGIIHVSSEQIPCTKEGFVVHKRAKLRFIARWFKTVDNLIIGRNRRFLVNDGKR